MLNSRFTFKELLSATKVEIPVLQRDYVQGNIRDKKAGDIRQTFVLDLVSHLTSINDDEMRLDFIYGKLINDELQHEKERQEEHLGLLLETVNKFAEQSGFQISRDIKRLENLNPNIFVPFDGQQRLTTLFLLHFMIYSSLGEDVEFLNNFSYKTKQSSRDFLEALLQNKHEFETKIWKDSFLTFITDRNWFYENWKYDPTVMSMLVMMDAFRIEINAVSDSGKFKRIHENLESSKKLSFDFLDIEEHNLDDRLYIKMNASGKELTDFEKFKSWLIEYVETSQIVVEDKGWHEKMDTIWYDFFWEAGKTETDGLFYHFIRKLIAFKTCAQPFKVTEEVLTKQKSSKLIYETLSGKQDVTFRFYTDNGLINSSTLNFIFRNLNFLSTFHNDNSGARMKKIWNKTFISEWSDSSSYTSFLVNYLDKLNLVHQTFLFSIFSYIDCLEDYSEHTLNEDKFYKWLRVGRNLIYNSRIDDLSVFFSALQSIEKFGINCLDITSSLTKENFIDFFPERQRREEYEKNDLKYLSWQEELILAENHPYFYGQILFLIELSKIDNEPDLERFKEIFSSLSLIFSENYLDSPVHLISRALLTIDHKWMPDYGSNRYLFCLAKRGNSRDRDENWRRIFNASTSHGTLLELIQRFQNFGSLELVISNFKVGVTDWRRLFLEFPGELDYAKQGLINYLKNGNHVRVLGQSRLSHYHRELRSSVLFNNFLKAGYQLEVSKYCEIKVDDQNDQPHVAFSLHERNIEIVFNPDTLKIEVRTFTGNETDVEGSLLTGSELNAFDEQLFNIISGFNTYTDSNS